MPPHTDQAEDLTDLISLEQESSRRLKAFLTKGPRVCNKIETRLIHLESICGQTRTISQ